MEGSRCADELGLKMREEFSVEHRENKRIAYTAMKRLHPARKSAPNCGYDFGKIGSVTGRGQDVHSESGMTRDRPEERARMGGVRRGQGSAHPVPRGFLPRRGDLTGPGRQRGRTRRRVGDVQ